jgi:hypothetical protein
VPGHSRRAASPFRPADDVEGDTQGQEALRTAWQRAGPPHCSSPSHNLGRGQKPERLLFSLARQGRCPPRPAASHPTDAQHAGDGAEVVDGDVGLAALEAAEEGAMAVADRRAAPIKPCRCQDARRRDVPEHPGRGEPTAAWAPRSVPTASTSTAHPRRTGSGCLEGSLRKEDQATLVDVDRSVQLTSSTLTLPSRDRLRQRQERLWLRESTGLSKLKRRGEANHPFRNHQPTLHGLASSLLKQKNGLTGQLCGWLRRHECSFPNGFKHLEGCCPKAGAPTAARSCPPGSAPHR